MLIDRWRTPQQATLTKTSHLCSVFSVLPWAIAHFSLLLVCEQIPPRSTIHHHVQGSPQPYSHFVPCQPSLQVKRAKSKIKIIAAKYLPRM